ncbi:MAG: hypothetical protein ABR915_03620 [Thermoguttaceae bacterium]
MSGFILSAAVLAVAADAYPREDATARTEATLRRVASLPADAQQAWLRRLEARLARAAQWTLSPEEARQDEARAAAKLHQPTVARETLAELLVQLDVREKAAISRLVRQYRAEVQESFQAEPAKFLERREAWFRVWSRWEAAGSPPDQQDRLIDWLEAAAHNSAPGSIGPLPVDPSFGGATALRPAVTAAEPPPPVAPRLELAPVKVRVPDPSVPAPPGVSPPAAEMPPLVRKPEASPTVPLHEAGSGPLASPTVVVPPPKPRTQASPEEPLPPMPPRATPLGDPLAMLPRTVSEGDRGPTKAPGLHPGVLGASPPKAPPSPVPPGDHAQVDVEGLAARIAGINLALRSLEGELEEKREWTAEQLQTALSRLDILVLRQKDLGLFRDLVPSKEQAKAGTIDSPRRAIASLANRIAETRERLGGPVAPASDAPREAERNRLDALSDRLATLSAEK